jgi:hypothetical protein
MKSKDDQSLIEVWEMKEQVQRDFENSKYKNYIDFIENDVKDFKIKYNIQNRKDRLNVEQQLTTA